MQDIYNNETYLKNNPNWHQEDAFFKAEKIFSILKANSVLFNSIAEIGCGSGEVLVQLNSLINKKECRLHGFDISADAIKIAENKKADNLQFHLADITDSADKSSFDVILVIDVIEHLHNYFAFLDAISAKSRYTVFHIPLDMFAWSLFREGMLIESKERVGHIHNFSEGFILSVLEDHGFKVIDKFYTEPISEGANFKQKFINLVRKTLFALNKRFATKTIGGYSLMVLCENKR